MRAVAAILLVALCLATVSAARLRGGFDMFAAEQQQEQRAAPQQGELVSFLQHHARAFAAQSEGHRDLSPSAGAEAAAQQAAPAGAVEASSDNVLAALEHTPHHALVQTGAKAGAKAKAPGEDGDGEDFGPCKTCVFVLERIKKGSNMLLPAICSELYHKYPDAYALCHQVLNALSINGNNVRYWLFEGCFKYEI